MTISLTKPYNIGYSAYFNGIELFENPYSQGLEEYGLWENGWREAENDDVASTSFSDEDDELYGFGAPHVDDDDEY